MNKFKCIIVNLLIIISFNKAYGSNYEIIDCKEYENQVAEKTKVISQYTPSKTAQRKNAKNTPKFIESPPIINQTLLNPCELKPTKILGKIKKQDQTLDFQSPSPQKQPEVNSPFQQTVQNVPKTIESLIAINQIFEKQQKLQLPKILKEIPKFTDDIDLNLSSEDETDIFFDKKDIMLHNSIMKYNTDNPAVKIAYSTQSDLPTNIDSDSCEYDNSNDFKIINKINYLKGKINNSLKMCKSLNKKIVLLGGRNENIEKNLEILLLNNNKLVKKIFRNYTRFI